MLKRWEEGGNRVDVSLEARRREKKESLIDLQKEAELASEVPEKEGGGGEERGML